jgi:hypothetical protein
VEVAAGERRISRDSATSRVSEPGTGDRPGALGTDVVAVLSYVAEVINQRLQFGAFRGQQGFAVEFGAEDLVFGGHASVLLTQPTSQPDSDREALPSRLVPVTIVSMSTNRPPKRSEARSSRSQLPPRPIPASVVDASASSRIVTRNRIRWLSEGSRSAIPHVVVNF